MNSNRLKVIAVVVLLTIGFVVGSLTGGSESGGDSHQHSADAAEVWTCSMHPQVRQPEPGACPICGMDLIPATSGGGDDLAPNQLILSERSKALAMIRTTKVRELGGSGGSLSMTGQVTKNQNENRVVTSWFGGRVDKLRVSSEGAVVRRGQVVAELYSPEIYSAHNDLLLGTHQLVHIANAEPFARRAIEATIEAAKTKLRLLGIKDSEIAKMAKAEKPWTRVPVRSPFSGTVIRKRVDEGQYVQAGSPLLELSDLARLWIELDAYADDIPLLSEGAMVEFTVDSIPNKKFNGTVTFIEPFVDQNTRTAVVRVEIENSGELRPGQYVTAQVESVEQKGVTSKLVIPRNAPMYAGRRSIVYVETKTGEGATYESRIVELGPVRGDFVVVKNGLMAGESVVSHGAFAIDADLQIKDGLSLMAAPDDVSRVEPSAPFKIQLAEFVQLYLKVQKALATDDAEMARSAMESLNTKLETLAPSDPTVVRFWEHPRDDLTAALAEIPQNIDQQRVTFEALSNALIQIVEMFGNPLDTPIRIAHCPMAFDNKGANWIQSEPQIRNAYFGSEMLACGSIERTVAPLNSPKLEPSSHPESQ